MDFSQQVPSFNEPVISVSKELPTNIATKTIPVVAATKEIPTVVATKTIPTLAATKEVPTLAATKEVPTIVATKTIPILPATKEVPSVTTKQIPTVNEPAVNVPQQAAANFPQQQAASSSAADGFASMNGGTTGGQGGQTVTVSSQSELEAALKGDAAKIVMINGIIKLSSEVAVGSNSSLIGANGNSGITGAGLVIKNVKNVIIQNLKFNSCLGSSKDCINATKSTNIWIDHCEFYNDRNNGKDYYDGLIDFTHACDYITVSWCSLHDHYKASLVGHSDSNGSEDTGKLHITYHHNYFKNIGSRLPSLRFGTGHIFNNVYENIETSSVNIRMGAQALVEGNVFRNAKKPISTNLDSKQEGSVIERNNDFGTTAGTNSITKKGNLNSVPYKYTADNVNSVYSAVTKGAGPK